MADFDDTFDPELGAACNRLAAFVEPLPEGAVIDPVSQLNERDLALILRRLYCTRHGEQVETGSSKPVPSRHGRVSVPITAKN
jgi:hypothetical protein